MEDINQSQYIIVEDIGKYYPIEILEVEGITIRGKKIGELDELIFTKARELGGTRRDFNIVYKKSHTRHYMCSQMTIERIIGDIAVLSLGESGLQTIVVIIGQIVHFHAQLLVSQVHFLDHLLQLQMQMTRIFSLAFELLHQK